MMDPDNNSRYEPEGEIARGGMGVVLRVKDIDLDRPLAMKRMASAPDATGGGTESGRFARFMEEAQVTAQLDHPAIVPVHELGFDDDGTGWYTMKLVEGRELGQIFDLARSGDADWSIARAIRVLVQVCQALAYAHGKGVIHRDLKPANIMVGEFGEVYVMDWGLAKVEGSEVSTPRATSGSESAGMAGGSLITLDGSVMGTPEFMPPEQARGEMEEVDEQSDVYSVGALLYQLLSGGPPFLGDTREVIRAVASEPPKPLPKSAPMELAAICNKAMAREKAERYSDATQLERELTRYLDGRVVEAHESGSWAEFKKLVQRNKALTAAVATVFGVLVAMLISQSVSNQKLETSRAEAVSALEKMAVSQGFSAGKSLDYGAASFWFNDAASWANDPEDTETHQVRARIAASRHVPCVRALLVPQKWPGPRRMEFSPDRRYLTLGHGNGTGGARRAVFQIVDVDVESLVTAPDGSMFFIDVAYCPTTGRIAAVPMEWKGVVHVWTLGGESSTIQSSNEVSSVEFSPDGAQLFIGANSGQLFDFSTGTLQRPLFSGKRQVVRDVKFSPDGDLLAVTLKSKALKETKLRVFELGNLGAEALFPGIVVRDVSPWIRFTDGGKMIAHDAGPGSSVLVEARTGKLGERTGKTYQDWSQEHSLAVTDRAVIDPVSGERKLGLSLFGVARFRPQNDTLLVCDPSLRELSLMNGETIRTIGSDRSSTEHIAVSADGNLVASWEVGGLVRFWDLQENDWSFPAGVLGNVIFSSSGSYVVRSGRAAIGNSPSTGQLQVYDVSRRAAAGSPLEFDGHLFDSDFSPDEKVLATAHRTGSIKLWDWQTGNVSRSITGLPSVPIALCHAPDSSWLAAYCKNGELVRVDTGSGEVMVLTTNTAPRQQFSLIDSVHGLEFTESGRWLVLWSLCHGVMIWDCERNEWAPAPPLEQPMSYIEILKVRGERVIFIEHRGLLKSVLHEWDLDRGEHSREPVEIKPGSCTGFDLSKDGRRLLINYRLAESVRLGELTDDGGWKWQAAHELGNGRAFFVPESPYAVSFSEDFPCQVRVVDLRDMSALVSPLIDQLGVAYRPVMSPDGRRVAAVLSAGDGGHARIWELLSELDPVADRLGAEGRRELTELAAEGAVGTDGWRSFDPAGWLARWKEFRLKNPEEHTLPKGHSERAR